jgi:Tfp pilus assembly protein PilF
MQNSLSNRQAAIVLPAILLAALFIAAGVIPISSLWGFNHLRYFSNYWIVVYAVLFGLAFIPASAAWLSMLIGRVSDRFGRTPPAVRILVIAGLAAVIFYVLRVHVHSLGDGYQRIYQIEKGYSYYHSEPLDFFLHAVLYRGLKIAGIASGELTYTLFSIIAGTAFVSIVLLVRFPEDEDSALLKSLLIFFGGSQLFFGYVESYSLVYIFSLLYLLLAASFLISSKGLPAASIMLALAMASHMTAVIFVPSFLYLIYHSFKHCKPRRLRDVYLPVIIGLLPFVAIVVQEIWLRSSHGEYVPSVSGGILPLYSVSEYSILSAQHFFDIVNQLLLICPVALILLIYLVFRKKPEAATKGLNPFAFIAMAGSVIMLLAMDPKLGYARDWDLMAMPAATIGLALVILSVSSSGAIRLRNYSKFVLASVSVLFLSSWVLTNAATSRQLARAEELLTLSEKGRHYSTELLAYYYRYRAHDSEKALQLLQKVAGIAENARIYNKIAKLQLDLGEEKEALKSIYAGLALDSNFAELHLLAGATFTRMGQPRLGLPFLLKARALEPDQFNIYHSLGNAYYRLDSIPQAAVAFKEAIRLQPDFASGYIELGNMLRLMRIYDSAYVYVQKGLKLDPDFPQGYELLELIKAELTPPPGR